MIIFFPRRRWETSISWLVGYGMYCFRSVHYSTTTKNVVIPSFISYYYSHVKLFVIIYIIVICVRTIQYFHFTTSPCLSIVTYQTDKEKELERMILDLKWRKLLVLNENYLLPPFVSKKKYNELLKKCSLLFLYCTN